MADIDTKLETGISLQEVAPEDDADLYRPDVDVSSVDERKLMRKIDFRLIPLLAAFYLMNTLDRGAIGNARVCSMLTSCADAHKDVPSCMAWRRLSASATSNTS